MVRTDKVDDVVEALAGNRVVVFPTDTVWGVGAAISSKDGLEKLYRVKKRDLSKPTAVLVADRKMAMMYGELHGKAEELADKNWPGALTLIVRATGVSGEAITKAGKVGLRVPDHDLLREVIGKLGEGIVTSSANFAGEPPPEKLSEIDQDFLSRVDMVLVGRAGGRKSSTVVDVTSDEWRVVRQGDVIV